MEREEEVQRRWLDCTGCGEGCRWCGGVSNEGCIHWLTANTMQVCARQEECCIKWAVDGTAMARI